MDTPPSQTAALPTGGAVGERPAGAPPSALPCLLVTTATESHGRRSQIARKAETLFLNAESMIKRVGLEKSGFFTRTFKENVTSRKLAESMNHSWNSGYGSKVFCESISVPERQERGAFHRSEERR